MSDPAAARDFLKCPTCHGMTRADLAGTPARCSCCAVLMYDCGKNDPVSLQSPIVARRVFQSASLRRADLAAGTQTL